MMKALQQLVIEILKSLIMRHTGDKTVELSYRKESRMRGEMEPVKRPRLRLI